MKVRWLVVGVALLASTVIAAEKPDRRDLEIQRLRKRIQVLEVQLRIKEKELQLLRPKPKAATTKPKSKSSTVYLGHGAKIARHALQGCPLDYFPRKGEGFTEQHVRIINRWLKTQRVGQSVRIHGLLDSYATGLDRQHPFAPRPHSRRAYLLLDSIALRPSVFLWRSYNFTVYPVVYLDKNWIAQKLGMTVKQLRKMDDDTFELKLKRFVSGRRIRLKMAGQIERIEVGHKREAWRDRGKRRPMRVWLVVNCQNKSNATTMPSRPEIR